MSKNTNEMTAYPGLAQPHRMLYSCTHEARISHPLNHCSRIGCLPARCYKCGIWCRNVCIRLSRPGIVSKRLSK